MTRTSVRRERVARTARLALLVLLCWSLTAPLTAGAALFRAELGPGPEPVGGGTRHDGVPDEPTIGAPSIPDSYDQMMTAPVPRSSAPKRVEAPVSKRSSFLSIIRLLALKLRIV
jgi:hypothetical protein